MQNVLVKEKSIIESQLQNLNEIDEKTKALVADYCKDNGINDLKEVTREDIRRFGILMLNKQEFTPRQQTYFKGGLERVNTLLRKEDYEAVAKEIEELDVSEPKDKKNKLLSFFIQNDIHSAEDITYDVRKKFEDYIGLYRSSKIMEYVKAFDLLKLEAIKAAQNPFEKARYTDPDEKLYFGYHPDYDTAMTFHYYQKKDNLVLDLSVNASPVLKRQTLDFVNYIFENESNLKMRNERFLMPLRHFFNVCVERGVKDINQLEKEDIEAYRESLKGNVGTKEQDYMQIVNLFRRFIFCKGNGRINFKANAWYLERFFDDDNIRVNSASPIGKIEFITIKDKKNRQILKDYEKKLFGNTEKSAQTIRCRHYVLLDFFEYLDQKGIEIENLGKADVKKYVQTFLEGGKKKETMNIKLMIINCLCDYLYKMKIVKTLINMSEYRQRTYYHHNDCSLSEEELRKEMEVTKNLEYTEKIMFLILRITGIRASEVCILKPNQMIEDNGNFYLKIWAQKMKDERLLPIIKPVYTLLGKYVSDMHREADEYIFQNRKGGAYCYGTFTAHVGALLESQGMKFKSHTSRHTTATRMDMIGVDISAIRQYLGHKTDEMTKHYIDYEWERAKDAIDMLHEEFERRGRDEDN